MSGTRTALGLALACAVVLGACDSGPSGPGTLEARVQGEAVGAVVLEVEGRGIRGFVGRGSAQVYSAAVPGRTDVHRVILVDPLGGEIAFAVEVDDRRMEGPVVTVVEAAGADDERISAGSVTVRVER